MSETSTKPYLIRAIHEWCVDNGYRPHLAVAVDEHTVVPREFVRDGEIVLNVSTEACNRLRMGNELIEFEARFNRVARQISIPVENVSAVYAAETGQGMAFEVQLESAPEDVGADAPAATDEPDTAPASTGRGPVLVESPQAAPRLVGARPGSAPEPTEPPPPKPGSRPTLTRVK